MRFASISLLCLSLATGASAFTAINGLTALHTDTEGEFDVIAQPGSGPRQIWCAAAQYANYVLGAASNTRIYLAQPTAKSAQYGGRRATRFTIAPDAELASAPGPNAGGNYSVSLDKIGYNLRLAHAEGFCQKFIEELFD